MSEWTLMASRCITHLHRVSIPIPLRSCPRALSICKGLRESHSTPRRRSSMTRRFQNGLMPRCKPPANKISMNGNKPLTSAFLGSNGETTSFSFRASTTLHVGALKMPINIDKSVTVPALNQLKGFGLNSLQILLPAAASKSQAPLRSLLVAICRSVWIKTRDSIAISTP